jgi:hypothetical protein
MLKINHWFTYRFLIVILGLLLVPSVIALAQMGESGSAEVPGNPEWTAFAERCAANDISRERCRWLFAQLTAPDEPDPEQTRWELFAERCVEAGLSRERCRWLFEQMSGSDEATRWEWFVERCVEAGLSRERCRWLFAELGGVVDSTNNAPTAVPADTPVPTEPDSLVEPPAPTTTLPAESPTATPVPTEPPTERPTERPTEPPSRPTTTPEQPTAEPTRGREG